MYYEKSDHPLKTFAIMFDNDDDTKSKNDQGSLEMLDHVVRPGHAMKMEYDRIAKKTLELINQMDNEIDIITFPVKLFHILQITPKYGLSHIISWRNCGQYFQIKNRDMFIQLIAPIFFGFKKFASFQRQLNLYGFKHVSVKLGMGEGVYSHDKFLQNHLELCLSMNRINTGKDTNKVHVQQDNVPHEPNVVCDDTMNVNVSTPPISTVIPDMDHTVQSSLPMNGYSPVHGNATSRYNINAIDDMHTSISKTRKEVQFDYNSCNKKYNDHYGHPVRYRQHSSRQSNAVRDKSNTFHQHHVNHMNMFKYVEPECMEPISVSSHIVSPERNSHECYMDPTIMKSQPLNRISLTQNNIAKHHLMRRSQSAVHDREFGTPFYHTEPAMKRPKLYANDLHMNHFIGKYDKNTSQSHQDISYIDQALVSLRESQKLLFLQMQMLSQSRVRSTRNQWPNQMDDVSYDTSPPPPPPDTIHGTSSVDSCGSSSELHTIEATQDVTTIVPTPLHETTERYGRYPNEKTDDSKIGEMCGREFHLVFESDDESVGI